MSRGQVLALLRARSGEYLSGEQVSAQLGLSRAAIWKDVDALRREGYEIEARTGLGYRLVAAPDALTEPEIRAAMEETRTVGRELHCLAEVDSTNTCAKKLALAGAPDGTAVIADCQTAGRGRLGRSFQSPRGKGIYLSVLLRPQLPPEKLLCVTALGAVAVCRAVERVLPGAGLEIKWTNDLVHRGRKLCGILTEMSLEGESGALQYLVMGIGLNVLQRPEDFSPEVAAMAGSLQSELGTAPSRPALAAAELGELDRLCQALQSGATAPYLAEYRRRCVTLGKEIRLVRSDGSGQRATALDVDDAFGLVIRREDGAIEVIRSGEASVRGMYGYAE